MTALLYVGSCNQPTPYFATSTGEGISVLAFDDQTGTAKLIARYAGIDNPTYLSVSADGTRIYANSERFGYAQGLVTALAFDPVAAEISHLDMVASRGSITSHNSITQDGRFLLVTNYALGAEGPDQSVVVFPIGGPEAIGPAVSSVAHAGRGLDPHRQERSHAHFVHQLPDGHVAVADLGLDRVFIYGLSERGTLRPASEIALPPGTGPRHLAWSPEGNWLFVIGELNSTVTSIDLRRDTAERACTASTIPSGSTGNHCSDLKISQDGRYLYAGNRGEDSIAQFEIFPDGALHLKSATPCGGATPRALALSPCGGWLLSANQDTDDISIFRIDRSTGQPGPDPHHLSIGTPMCLKFARASR